MIRTFHVSKGEVITPYPSAGHKQIPNPQPRQFYESCAAIKKMSQCHKDLSLDAQHKCKTLDVVASAYSTRAWEVETGTSLNLVAQPRHGEQYRFSERLCQKSKVESD